MLNPDLRRSTSGFIFWLGGGPVTWLSQRQPLVTYSTMEAEYVSASLAAREIVWLRRVLKSTGHICEGPV